MYISANEIQPSMDNVFLLWEDKVPDHVRLSQISTCLRSIRHFCPTLRLLLFSNCLNAEHLFDAENVFIVRWDYETLAAGSPLAGKVPRTSNWCLWSDVFRVLSLWKWGGSYIDVDDICIRTPAFPRFNIMAACLLGSDDRLRWGGESISTQYLRSKYAFCSDLKFRFGADPMMFFSIENAFLQLWLEAIPSWKPHEWGQILPSALFSRQPEKMYEFISPTPWPDLLLHPYDEGHHSNDQRYEGQRVSTEQRMDELTADNMGTILMKNYDFFLLKNHEFRSCQNTEMTRNLLEWMVADATLYISRLADDNQKGEGSLCKTV